MRVILAVILFVLCVDVSLFAVGKEQKGDIKQKEVKPKEEKYYIIDEDGQKYDIMRGKDAALLFYKLGISSVKTKEYSSALEHFEAALDSFLVGKVSDEQLMHKIIIEIKNIEGKIGAESKLKKKENYQYYSSLYFYFGTRESSQKKYKEAVYFYKRSIYYNPKNRDAYNNIGISYDLLKQYDKAVSSYKKGLEITPKNKTLHYNLACSYALQNKQKESLEYLEKAINLGFRNKNKIMNDNTLKNISSTKRFKELMSKLN